MQMQYRFAVTFGPPSIISLGAPRSEWIEAAASNDLLRLGPSSASPPSIKLPQGGPRRGVQVLRLGGGRGEEI